MRVMFSCVGRRIELMSAFRAAAASLDIELEVHGADSNAHAPGLYRCDAAHRVPPIADADYVPRLLELVGALGIELMIPLLDPELEKLSAAREQFAAGGCCVPISDPVVVRLFADKLRSYEHFLAHGIDTPRTWAADEALKLEQHTFPYFMKPTRGSASMGNYRINDLDDLRVMARRVPQPIAQEFVAGVEHTLDAYTGLNGELRCVVPRRRLEVRQGEVSKSLVVMEESLIEAGRKVINSISGWRGVVTIQCIRTPDGRTRVIEVNPRFGGGVPLAIRAGADFPRWLMQELRGERPDVRPDTFVDGLRMLRFDQSVFVTAAGTALDPP